MGQAKLRPRWRFLGRVWLAERYGIVHVHEERSDPHYANEGNFSCRLSAESTGSLPSNNWPKMATEGENLLATCEELNSAEAWSEDGSEDENRLDCERATVDELRACLARAHESLHTEAALAEKVLSSYHSKFDYFYTP